MKSRRTAAALLCALLLVNTCALAQTQNAQATPTPDPNDPVSRIRDEGTNRSQVMQTLNALTNVIGPRLTGSPGMRRANEWTRDTLAKWGLVNSNVEPWGTFGRGWQLRHFSAEVVEPQVLPLNAYPKAWSPATRGALTAEVVYVDAKDFQGLQKFKGALRGKIVLNGAARDLTAHFEPDATRRAEKNLLELANAPDPSTRPARPRTTPEQRAASLFNAQKLNFFQDEGAALVIDPSRGDDGTIFVQQAAVPQPVPADERARQAMLNRDPDAPRQVRPWDKNAPAFAPQMMLSIEQYNRLARMLEAGERVRVRVNLDAQFLEQDLMAYNTVAEIPGTDLKDEVVMLGAHLDSWHTATGATDNAAGVGVMMEAVRILKALNLQPRRTIRIALWSGEEQGLLGSRFYVSEHFGGIPAPGAPAVAAAATPTKPEHERLNVYFNADSGTGAIRGIFLQGNEALRPIFRRWLVPFREFKVGQTTYNASTVTASNTDGSDFLSFDAAGLNGFDFIQDEMEYETRTWHSSQDTFDRLVEDDLKEAAVIVAAFVYNAATMDGRLPRKQRQK